MLRERVLVRDRGQDCDSINKHTTNVNLHQDALQESDMRTNSLHLRHRDIESRSQREASLNVRVDDAWLSPVPSSNSWTSSGSTLGGGGVCRGGAEFVSCTSLWLLHHMPRAL